MWAAVSKSWNYSWIFIEKGVKINTDLTIDNILVLAFEEMKKNFKDQHFTFQVDGTPSHTSILTQDWCKHHFPKFWSKEMCPPALPDLNPMDFFLVWSMLEAKVSCYKC